MPCRLNFILCLVSYINFNIFQCEPYGVVQCHQCAPNEVCEDYRGMDALCANSFYFVTGNSSSKPYCQLKYYSGLVAGHTYNFGAATFAADKNAIQVFHINVTRTSGQNIINTYDVNHATTSFKGYAPTVGLDVCVTTGGEKYILTNWVVTT